MSKIKVDMIKCDLCARPGVTYSIGLPVAVIEVDLCDGHARPLHELADRGRPSAVKRPPKPRNEPMIRLSDPAE